MQLQLLKVTGRHVCIIDGIDIKITLVKNRNLKCFKTKYFDKYLDLRRRN